MPETSTVSSPLAEVYADYFVYGLAPGVVLAHGDEAVAGPIYDHVSESPAGLRRQRLWLAARGRR